MKAVNWRGTFRFVNFVDECSQVAGVRAGDCKAAMRSRPHFLLGQGEKGNKSIGGRIVASRLE